MFISSIFPNKEGSQLKKRWQGCLKKTLWQVPWTQQEDDLLVQIITDKGHTRKWKEIAEELNARSDLEVYRHGRQCRERWNNHLDPNIARGPFTEEEDLKLFQIYKEVGKKWAEISKKMKSRTENAVKNRFNSLIKKLKGRQNTGLGENPSIMSIESEADGGKVEKVLVEQFLQQFEATPLGAKLEKSRSNNNMFNCKNELQDNAESIFESDSESEPYSQNHRNPNLLDKAFSKRKNSDRSKGHNYGDLNDCLRKMPNYQMEEEYMGNQTHNNRFKLGKYDMFSNQAERLNSMSMAHPSYQGYTSQQFPHSTAIKRRQGGMISESSPRDYNKAMHSSHYQSRSANIQNIFGNAGHGNNSGMYQPTPIDTGYRTHEHGNIQDNSMLPNMKNLADILECENSNDSSPLKQNRFPFENYEARGVNPSLMKLEEDSHEMSPSRRLTGINHQFKAKRLDKYRTQYQIGRTNLQYAIVDLTKNEIYMVHPVTKENFNGVISKMNGEESLNTSPFENAQNNMKNSELFMLGKSGEHSPTLGYLQSLIGKSNLIAENNSLINTSAAPSADSHDKSKLNSMTQAEKHFQDLKKIFSQPSFQHQNK